MEFFDSTKKPIDLEKRGYSVDVLIDIDGKRERFDIGWYDFDDKVWRFYNGDTDNIRQIFAGSLVWAYLPLKELDNIKLEAF